MSETEDDDIDTIDLLASMSEGGADAASLTVSNVSYQINGATEVIDQPTGLVTLSKTVDGHAANHNHYFVNASNVTTLYDSMGSTTPPATTGDRIAEMELVFLVMQASL